LAKKSSKTMKKRGRKSRAELTAPLLHVVPSTPHRVPPPPHHLSPPMKQFWSEVLRDFTLEAHHSLLLEAACSARFGRADSSTNHRGGSGGRA
jgi:hypothetical protein